MRTPEQNEEAVRKVTGGPKPTMVQLVGYVTAEDRRFVKTYCAAHDTTVSELMRGMVAGLRASEGE